MTWLNSPMRSIAPPNPAAFSFASDQQVWHLSLDQIEGDTGELSGKRYAPASEAGTSTFCFDTGNVLYSKLRPYLNKVIVPDEPGIATTELIPLRPNPAILDQRFLAYYLRSSAFVNQASHHVAGAKMPRVVMDWFWEHEFPLPTPMEQGRIVELLDEADRLRRLSREASAKAERILPALFLKMFGAPSTNPKGWRKERIGELGNVVTGRTPPTQEEGMFGGTIPFATPSDLDTDLSATQRSLTETGAQFSKVARAGSALVGCIGNIGKMRKTPVRTSFNQQINAVEWSAKVNDDFGIAALSFEVETMKALATFTTLPILNKSSFASISVIVPPDSLQKEFSRLAEQLNKSLVPIRRMRSDLNQLFSVLLSTAFSGQLTAQWREAHMKELLAEMEVQARQLKLPTPQEAAV